MKQILVFDADNLIGGPEGTDGLRRVRITPPGHKKQGDFYYKPLTTQEIEDTVAMIDDRDGDDEETNVEKFNFAVETVFDHAVNPDGTPMFRDIDHVKELPGDVLTVMLSAMTTGKV